MTILCDLDGVIYRGQAALPGVSNALGRLDRAAIDVYFITNNSTRTPEQAAAKVRKLTGAAVEPEQILSSCLAAVSVLGPEDGPVLVVGECGVRDAVQRAGLEETIDPARARSVLVGLTRDLSYGLIGAAMSAIRNGARFVATNDDPTLPTEDGFLPGAGSIVAAIAAASGTAAEVAGKPNPPMRDLIRSRGVESAWVIGDRGDTDIALGRLEGDWRTILVLSGVTGPGEAGRAGADHVVADFSAAVDLVLGSAEQS